MIKDNNISYNGEKKRQIREDYLLPSIKKSNSLFSFFGIGEHHHQLKANPDLRDMNLMSIDFDKRKANLLRAPDTRCISLQDYCTSVGDKLPEDKRFGTIWLDYCSSYYCGYGVNNDLRALRNVMRESGELWITMRKGREGGKKGEMRMNEFRGLPKGASREQIEQWMFRWIYIVCARIGILVKAELRLDYQSTPVYDGRQKDGPSAMMVYKLTWERLEKPTDRPYMFDGVKVINLDLIK